MLINLTDIFTEEGKSVAMEVPLELTGVDFQGEHFMILEKTPVRLALSNRGAGRAQVEADAEVAVGMKCDRCLKDVTERFELHVDAEVVSPERANEEEAEEQSSFMKGYQLDVDSLISNEIFTCWPLKVLCREDCKGLCRVCGKDLNEGECGCDTFVPDPRMAAIMDIFRENKEV
ncbi:MAG TPA: DUF177 domain-containing protein [Candidatus Eisenbergiella merdipullorum]|uniref:DUF177 domain-containing protein n=1 Tax=Candidatus Eisenbergiella merdipullorum TaxID=2838553 RepID=A0A9D2I7C8_9FIRM|nr:DUF177 domain-containing protein [Candidatus Eisenbergiella merdipullorum]